MFGQCGQTAPQARLRCAFGDRQILRHVAIGALAVVRQPDGVLQRLGKCLHRFAYGLFLVPLLFLAVLGFGQAVYRGPVAPRRSGRAVTSTGE